MFDNLREDAASSSLYEEEAKYQPAAGTSKPAKRRSRRILGMNPQQRFIIALMLMFAVCSLGAMCLLITGKIGI
jgi:hypothetical protein